jgi:hypothetical protein
VVEHDAGSSSSSTLGVGRLITEEWDHDHRQAVHDASDERPGARMRDQRITTGK